MEKKKGVITLTSQDSSRQVNKDFQREQYPRICRKIICVHLFNEVVSDFFLCVRNFFMINNLAV